MKYRPGCNYCLSRTLPTSICTVLVILCIKPVYFSKVLVQVQIALTFNTQRCNTRVRERSMFTMLPQQTKPCRCTNSMTVVHSLHLLGCAVVASSLTGINEHAAGRQHDASRATRPMGFKPAMLLFSARPEVYTRQSTPPVLTVVSGVPLDLLFL